MIYAGKLCASLLLGFFFLYFALYFDERKSNSAFKKFLTFLFFVLTIVFWAFAIAMIFIPIVRWLFSP